MWYKGSDFSQLVAGAAAFPRLFLLFEDEPVAPFTPAVPFGTPPPLLTRGPGAATAAVAAAAGPGRRAVGAPGTLAVSNNGAAAAAVFAVGLAGLNALALSLRRRAAVLWPRLVAALASTAAFTLGTSTCPPLETPLLPPPLPLPPRYSSSVLLSQTVPRASELQSDPEFHRR